MNTFDYIKNKKSNKKLVEIQKNSSNAKIIDEIKDFNHYEEKKKEKEITFDNYKNFDDKILNEKS